MNLIKELQPTKRALLLTPKVNEYEKKWFPIGEMISLGNNEITFRYINNPDIDKEDLYHSEYVGIREDVLNSLEMGRSAKSSLMRRLIDPHVRGDFGEWVNKMGLEEEYARHLYDNDFLTLLCFVGGRIPNDGFCVRDTLENAKVPFKYIFHLDGYEMPKSKEFKVGEPLGWEKPDYVSNGLGIAYRFFKKKVGYINEYQTPGLLRLMDKSNFTSIKVFRYTEHDYYRRCYVKVSLTNVYRKEEEDDKRRTNKL